MSSSSRVHVIVEWEDANYQRDQMSHDEAANLSTPFVRTYGVLIDRNEKRIVVAGEVLDEDGVISYRAVTTVPMGMVKRVRRAS